MLGTILMPHLSLRILLLTLFPQFSLWLWQSARFDCIATREINVARAIEASGGQVEFRYTGPTWIPRYVRPHLPRLNRVQYVCLRNARTSHDLLLQLGDLTYLEDLDVTGTDFADEHCEKISSLTHLKGLGLGATRVTDAGLQALSNIPRITSISVWDTDVSDSGIVNIVRHHLALETLSLSGTRVSDIGVHELQTLKQLRFVLLDDTGITDLCVQSLGELTSLEELWVSNTNLSPHGAEQLRALLPRCMVIDENK